MDRATEDVEEVKGLYTNERHSEDARLRLSLQFKSTFSFASIFVYQHYGLASNHGFATNSRRLFARTGADRTNGQKMPDRHSHTISSN
jgi:hypothetical protein